MISGNTMGSGRSISSPFNLAFPRKVIIGVILLVALVAFEAFNYDTTRFALDSLLGPVSFAGLRWATVLAIAFCAIDFAGLARLFTPEQGDNEPRAVWYLTGAWLLGATMNAVMTWWAVNLTLLSHDLGNEVLGRAELLRYVPLFVAILVWLTRILFIGAFSIAGDHIFDLAGRSASSGARIAQPKRAGRTVPADRQEAPARPFNPQPKSRIRPQPVAASSAQPSPSPMQAQGREH